MGALLIITGSMGAGKTSALGEASDILGHRGTVHAAIDVDALGLSYLGATDRNNVAIYNNLRSVCRDYAGLGVTRFLLARALESRSELETWRDIVSVAEVRVCRLTACVETMEERVRIRETGVLREQYVSRVAELNAILDRARVEDFCVSSENLSVTEVALEMLTRAGWISE
ncbi:MAG TPA: hypothetical protein VMJ35_08725 [Dongiaceae bacterium]|nr:hypothetical protein [Dongiaceae bacterium]